MAVRADGRDGQSMAVRTKWSTVRTLLIVWLEALQHAIRIIEQGDPPAIFFGLALWVTWCRDA